MKHEIQRASSVANVEFTHNKISVNEDAEMAIQAPLQTWALVAVTSDLSLSQLATLWSGKPLQEAILGGDLQQMCDSSDRWTLNSICLKSIPRKWSKAELKNVCRKKNVPCAEGGWGGQERGRKGGREGGWEGGENGRREGGKGERKRRRKTKLSKSPA